MAREVNRDWMCALWCSAAAVQSPGDGGGAGGGGGTWVSTCTRVNDKSLTHSTGFISV